MLTVKEAVKKQKFFASEIVGNVTKYILQCINDSVFNPVLKRNKENSEVIICHINNFMVNKKCSTNKHVKLSA